MQDPDQDHSNDPDFDLLDTLYAQLSDSCPGSITDHPINAQNTNKNISPLCPSRHAMKNSYQISSPDGFVSGYELMERIAEQPAVTTGCSSLDDLLYFSQYNSFGLRLGETYEVAGEPRSGKSQLIHQLAITCQLPISLGGLEKEVIYLDSSHTFSPARIMQIAQSFSRIEHFTLSTSDLLSGIQVASLSSSSQFLPCLAELRQMLESSPDRYGFLLIDSLTARFRGEYSNQPMLHRQQALQEVLHEFTQLARDFGIAVIATNQIVSQPSSTDHQFSSQPVGGHIMAHWADHRILLSCLAGSHRSFNIIDSSVFPESSTRFIITSKGIQPVGETP